MPKPTSCWGMLRRRECLVPTWRGWIMLLMFGLGLLVVGVIQTQSFLAINAPVQSRVLVVEGWLPDYAMAAVLDEQHRSHYSTIFVTGGPLEQGSALSRYGTWAELGATTLIALGLDTNIVQAVPAPRILQDRTYASATALRAWLHQRGRSESSLNVVSLGVHARRTRLLYRKAFGDQCVIGIVSIENRAYDPQHWWKSSEGVRTVTGEVIAYAYARFFFRPPPPTAE